MKIILTKAEISSQIQKMRGGWEAKFHELQSQPAQREEFEEHLNHVKESIQEKKKGVYGDRDFLAANVVKQSEEADLGAKILKLKKKALQKCAQQDEAEKRREVSDKARQEKLQEWLTRSDARREAKLEQDRMRKERQTIQEVQKDWLKRLVVVCYTEKLKATSLKARELKRYLAQKTVSARTISMFILRCMSFKRRQKLYTNIVRARLAFTAYARHARLGVFHGSMPIVRSFMQMEGVQQEANSLSGALRQFKKKVVTIQRWWRGFLIMRLAYVEFFLPLWMEIQQEAYSRQAEVEALKHHGHENPISAHRPLLVRRNTFVAERTSISVVQAGAGARKPSIQWPSGHHHKRRNSREEKRKAIEEGLDRLPAWMIQILIREYIIRMQKTHINRVKAWEEDVRKDDFKHDLEGFGVVDEHEHESSDSDEDPHFHRPRSVYVDRIELEVLVKESMATWRDGGWKELRYNRSRMLKHAFKQWFRVLHTTKERAILGIGPSKGAESPKPPSINSPKSGKDPS